MPLKRTRADSESEEEYSENSSNASEDVEDYEESIASDEGNDDEKGISNVQGVEHPIGGSIYQNRQRVLIISSRGITARYRHLMEDFKKLIPHHKKDNKLDSKGDIQSINEIADMKSCNQILYLETRKRQDLYMYLSKTPHGPSAKFYVVNVHTMDELKLTGNCMIGSRPLLNFDTKFDSAPHWQVLKTMLTDCFGTPLGHPKSKPFVDRIMSFFVVKNNICKRENYFLNRCCDIVIFIFIYFG